MSKIQLRRGTAAEWTSADPTLSSGEIGFETDTNKIKIGDGSTAWTSLAYFASNSVLNKYDATTAPTTGDDDGDGYSVGSVWIDVTADTPYICVDASTGAAVWTDISGGGSGSSSLEYQTEITTNTTLDGSQKGLNKVYPVNSATAKTITITTGDYVANDVINIERRGQGSVEIIADTGVRIRGVRNSENRYFINDVNSMVALLCRGSEEFGIIGNLSRGYTGAVTTSSYTILREGDTAVDITVIGTGFSENMIVTVSANATQSSAFTYVSATQITLHLTAVGVEDDTVTVTFDNGQVFVDTDAITIASATSIPTGNLTHYYRFDNSLVDEVAANSGTGTNIAYATGKGGDAVDTDGSDSYVTIPDATDLSYGDGTTDSPFSISFLIKFDTLDATIDFILNKRATVKEYQILTTNSKLKISLNDESAGSSISVETTSAVFSISTWYHVILTYDGSGSYTGITLYINGSSVALTDASSGSYTAMEASSEDVYLATNGSSPSGAGLNGQMQRLGFWDIELTSDNATDIYAEEFTNENNLL